MGLDDLKQITANLAQPPNPALLVDYKDNDDCGIFRLDGGEIIAQSVDFITPVVDDPFLYGAIAAANALSDIFAKNATPKTALSLLMWDSANLTTADANAILQGALNKLNECGCALLGGHSVNDREQKFGLSVTGVVEGHFWRNNTAQIGDAIILTKPIGSGILTTAMKGGLLEFRPDLEVVEKMAELNLKAAKIAREFEMQGAGIRGSKHRGAGIRGAGIWGGGGEICDSRIHAATDVSGFGLIGHLLEMTNPALTIELDAAAVRLFARVEEFANLGAIPGGTHRNKAALESSVKNASNRDCIALYDAQTSGGLLLALEENAAAALDSRLREGGVDSHIIARCVKRGESAIVVR